MNDNRASEPEFTLLRPMEATALLPGVSYQSLMRWARQGKVAHVKLPNGRILFRRSDIEDLLAPVDPKVDPDGDAFDTPLFRLSGR